ncbi:hypothetical protein BH24ACT4_BH24ACT4_10880 [soil metagenome]
MRPGPVNGRVEVWDDDEGVGTIRTEDGSVLDLQCTNLAEGSRTTQVGTAVTAVVVPGHHGRWQAFEFDPAATESRARPGRGGGDR